MSSDRASRTTPLLVFDDLKLEITLDGFSHPLAERLAHAWLGRLSSDAAGLERFRIRLATDPDLSYTEAEIRESLLDGHLRHHPTEDGDRLEVPGVQVDIWPDRDEAAITVHPDLLRPGAPRDKLIQLAAEGALHRALLHCGAFLLHAAAFELEGLAVLVVGPSGAGKSTLSAVALAAGGKIVSDDALIVRTDAAGEVTVRPSRPDLLFRPPTPELLTASQRRQLHPVTIAGTCKWLLSRTDHSDLFLASLRPREVLLLAEKRSASLVEITPADQSKLVAAMVAASFTPYLAHDRYQRKLQSLIHINQNLVAMCRLFKLSTGCLSSDNQPDFARRVVLALRAPAAPV